MALDLIALENAGPVVHARSYRRTWAAETRRASGVPSSADLVVTQRGAGANMSVDVAAGFAFVDSGTQTEGFYPLYSDATTNVAIAAADPTNARIDLIVARVQDTELGDGSDAFTIEAVTGTPSGSPVAPSAPARSSILGQIAVAHSVTSIVNANITDKRTFLPTGPLVKSVGGSHTASPPLPMSGQFLVAMGTTVLTTSGAGGFSINFPTPFPNGLITGVVTAGDTTGSPLVGYAMLIDVNCSAGHLNGVVYRVNGVVAVSQLCRLNWIAWGW